MRFWSATSLALLMTVGCGSRVTAKRIAELELPEPHMESPAFEHQRVLVRRFSDGRPERHGKTLPGGGFFHSGHVSEYTSFYRVREGRDATQYEGWLPTDIPYLLQRSLPGDNVFVADELPDAGAMQNWDYIVEGRVLVTRHTWRSAAAWVLIGFIGTPSMFSRYELSYELSVYHGDDPDHAVLTRTYDFDERVAAGMYYNNKRISELPLYALRTTLERSAQDLVQEVAKHHGRVRPLEVVPDQPVVAAIAPPPAAPPVEVAPESAPAEQTVLP
ncbi:MAG: hypothetical protein AAF721_19595 [Myxococcota bacterium]